MKYFLFFVMSLVVCSVTHAQHDTLYIPPQPKDMPDHRYERFSNRIIEGAKYKDRTDVPIYIRQSHIFNIAAGYRNLGTQADTVFFWFRKGLEINKYRGCGKVLGWYSKTGGYEKCDSIEWKKICNYCRDYLNSEEAQEIKRKKEEEKRKELANLDKKLVQEIEAIAIADQKYRQKITDAEKKYGEKSTQVDSLWTLQNHLDSVNLTKVEKFISKYGYPTRKMVGKDYRFIAFSVIQHSTTEKMLYYLPLFIELAERKELSKNIVTLVIDRIHWQKFGTQLYGTQSSSKPILIYKEEERNSRLEKLAQGKLELGQITFPNYMIIDVGQSCKIMYP